MPQESKSKGSATGESVAHEQTDGGGLEGWIPEMASEDDVRGALEEAFDYRGDITLTLRDGSVIEGFVFDRDASGASLADCTVRLFPKDSDEKMTLSFGDIARLEFSGKDTAAGKSFEKWMDRYKTKLRDRVLEGAGGEGGAEG